jgi:hypothetical protein
MTAATEVIRSCAVCGVSIEGRRSQTTTCSDGCRQAKRRGASLGPGNCRGCGGELPASRELRWHCSRDCALRATPATRIEAPMSARPCGCQRSTGIPDPDGQHVCLSCGRPKSPSPKPNGFNDLFALMITDADGQYRHKPHRLNYGDLDHLRTRLAPKGVDLPSAPRACAGCGGYLRRARVGSLCETCAPRTEGQR